MVLQLRRQFQDGPEAALWTWLHYSGFALDLNGIIPTDHGKNFFTGSPAGCCFLTNPDCHLASGGSTIDRGLSKFVASAYLGGYQVKMIAS